MIKELKYRLLQTWDFMRVIRLGLGLFILIEGIKSVNVLSLILGGLLLAQAFLNVGCCGTSGCETNRLHNKNNSYSGQEAIEYEEIKNEKP